MGMALYRAYFSTGCGKLNMKKKYEKNYFELVFVLNGKRMLSHPSFFILDRLEQMF
jgi:hypothetical protein